MPRRNDLLVGQIALDLGLVTKPQLDEAVREQASQDLPKPIGVLLVARGFLSDNQLVRIIDEHARRMKETPLYADRRKQDVLFGKVLVAQGRCTEAQVNAGLARQQDLAEEGQIKRLGEILGLDAEAVQETLKEQNKTLMACPGCGARFNVVGSPGACPKCAKPLARAEGVQADETAYNLKAIKGDLSQSVSDAMDDSKKIFGKFVLVREIGSGGFGAVYRAFQRDLGRHVALKFLHSEEAEDVQRFVREAQTAAKLSHPHIVPIYEVGEHGGKHYLAMEFVDGQTLNKLRLDARRAAAVMHDAAGAVAFAHDKGIIHRDLKPQNMMLAGDHVWVMDFGLAKQLKGGTTLTMSGSVVGTPAYMPPEQAEGRKCDERSDVYSLGATLYELLAGHPPFEGETPLAVLKKVTDSEAAPLRRAPADLATIAAKAMEKDASRRYAGAKEFADDLKRWLDGEPISARPASLLYRLRKRVWRNKAVSALIAAAAVAAGYSLGPAWVEVRGERRIVWPAGRSRVTVKVPDFDVYEGEVQTSPWRVSKLDPPLVPDHGFVVVLSNPSQAKVVLSNGASVMDDGIADGRRIKVAKGPVHVMVRLLDHEDFATAVTVGAGEQVILRPTLTRSIGHLAVSAHPEGISMKAYPAGSKDPIGIYALPVGDMALPTGRYSLRFQKENHFERSLEVAIAKAPPGGNPSSFREGRSTTVWRREAHIVYAHASLNSMQIWSSLNHVPAYGTPTLSDLDGDDHVDCVLVAGSRIYALSGKSGEKIFELEAPAACATRPAWCDFDADHFPDCVIGSERGMVYALSGRDGTRLWQYKTGGQRLSSPALADINGDKIPDCIIGADDSKLYALSGRDGSPLWTFNTESPIHETPALADLDLDGTPDCIVASSRSGAYAVSGRNGTLLWTALSRIRIDANPAVGDLDRDGIPDCVLRSRSAGLLAISGKDGHVLWRRPLDDRLAADPRLADLNRDGIDDCIVGFGDSGLLALSGADGAKLWECDTGDEVASAPAVADIDRDGALDCIVGVLDSRVLAISGGDGRTLWEFVVDGGVWASPAVADFDGDGRMDCAIVTLKGTAYAIRGSDSDTLWQIRTAGLIPFAPVTADLDRDDFPDCLSASHHAGVYAHSGRDGAPLWQFPLAEGIGSGISLAELDADGIPDCVVGTVDFGVYAISGKTGSQLWRHKTGLAVRSTPGFSDLNGDGTPDCVFGSDDRRVYALSGRDGTVLWSFSAGAQVMSSPALADMNDDGIADCVIGSHDTHVYALSGRDGSLLWKFKTRRAVSARVLTEDFDADRMPDFIVASQDGTLYVISGRDGRLLWSVEVGGRVRDDPALVRIDDDETLDVILMSQAAFVHALSGRDGRTLWRLKLPHATTGTSVGVLKANHPDGPICLAVSSDGIFTFSARTGDFLGAMKSTRYPTFSHNLVFSTIGDRSLGAHRFNPLALSPVSLERHGSWKALLRLQPQDWESESESAVFYYRGLAHLRLSMVSDALLEFRQASKLGLRSPELHAAWIEACLVAGEPIDIPRIHWITPLLLLMPGTLTAEQRRTLAEQITGDEPHLLILAGRYGEALAALPQGDTWDWQALALRALAKHAKGDVEGARADLGWAFKANPHNRDLKQLLEETAPRK